MKVALIVLIGLAANGASSPVDCDGFGDWVSDALGSYYNGGITGEEIVASLDEIIACEGVEREEVDTAYQRLFHVVSMEWYTNRIGDAAAQEGMQGLLESYIDRFGVDDLPGWFYKDRSFLRQLEGETMLAISDMRAALAKDLADGHRIGVLRRMATQLQDVGYTREAVEAANEAASLAYENDVAALTLLTTRRMRAATVLLDAFAALERDVEAIEAATAELEEVASGHLDHIRRNRRNRAFQHQMSRGSALRNLAVAYQVLGRADEAVLMAREALEMFPESERRRTTWARTLLGSSLRAAGQLDESEAILRELTEEDDLSASGRSAAHEQLGQTLSYQHRIDEAQEHFLRANELSEQENHELGFSSARMEKLAFEGPTFFRFISFLITAGRNEDAFLQLDSQRAQSIRQSRRLAQQESLSPEDRHELEQLRRERIRLHERLSASSDSTEQVAVELARVEASLSRIAPPQKADPGLSIPDLQARLEHDERVLVSYFLGDPAHAFVVRADTFAAVPLPVESADVTELVKLATAFVDGPTNSLNVDGAALHGLYEAVVAPIEHLLPPDAPLTIIPDGALHEVPFGMLVDQPPEPHQYHEWSYLIRRNPISIDLAAALVGVRDDSKARGGWSIGAFGVSRFERGLDSDGMPGEALRPLPSVPAELAAIRRHFPRGRYALEDQATRSAFMDALPQARILHVASHVVVQPEQPVFSTIMLNGNGEDGSAIYLYDIVDRTMIGDLVVLSACDTGMGRLRLNDGIVGLQSVFRIAGASASVATMWSIDDEVATDLVERFYHYLRRGASKDVALQKAQLDYLDQNRGIHASPFLWAGFALSGDHSPIDVGGRSRADLAWMLGGLMLLIGAHVVGRRWIA